MKKFTFIELLIVIAIFGILVSILIPSLREIEIKIKRCFKCKIKVKNHSLQKTLLWPPCIRLIYFFKTLTALTF